MKVKVLIMLVLAFILAFTITGAAGASSVTVSADKADFLANSGAVAVDFPTDATILGNQPFGTSLQDYSCVDGATGITIDGLVTVKEAVNQDWICYLGAGWNAGPGNINPTPLGPTIVANGEDDYHVVEFLEPVTAVAFELLTNSVAQETIIFEFADATTEAVDIDGYTAENAFEFVGFTFAKPVTGVTIDTTYGARQNEGIAGIWMGVDEEGPVTTDTSASPNPIAINSGGTVTANVDDTNTGGSLIKAAEYSLDGGTTWSGMTADDGAFDEIAEDVSASFTPTSVGIFDLCVRGTDAADNTGAVECAMLVVFDPDGGFVTGGGWIDSPSDRLAWDQGFEVDTSGWSGTITRVESGTDGIASNEGDWHAIVDGGSYSFFDDSRDTWPGTWVAEIDVYLDPGWSAGTGFDYTVAAWGSDGSHQRDYIFHVTKDTSTGSLLVAGSNNTNSAPREDLENINHYEVTDAGWYTLQHTFYEDGGALAVDLNLLAANGNILFTETRYNAADTILDEVGGNGYAWFTFINVPSGIAVDEHQLFIPLGPTGKASFGFVAKYKKGADVPEGNTQFQFQAGDLNFHSTSYDWLLVTGNNYAKFKGAGTINGELAPTGEHYKFQLWAGDGDPDTFRIKIWYEEAGTEVVVYDNGMDQPIAGGSIKVHAK